jgi:hypothetical protein
MLIKQRATDMLRPIPYSRELQLPRPAVEASNARAPATSVGLPRARVAVGPEPRRCSARAAVGVATQPQETPRVQGLAGTVLIGRVDRQGRNLAPRRHKRCPVRG